MRYRLTDISPHLVSKALKEGRLTPCHLFIDLPDTFDFQAPPPPAIIFNPMNNQKVVVPTKDWPLLLKPLKFLAQGADRGLGDIVERLIGSDNSETFKDWWRRHFKTDCGCNARKEWLNERFPL